MNSPFITSCRVHWVQRGLVEREIDRVGHGWSRLKLRRENPCAGYSLTRVQACKNCNRCPSYLKLVEKIVHFWGRVHVRVSRENGIYSVTEQPVCDINDKSIKTRMNPSAATICTSQRDLPSKADNVNLYRSKRPLYFLRRVWKEPFKRRSTQNTDIQGCECRSCQEDVSTHLRRRLVIKTMGG